MGRAFRYQKRTAHIFVVVAEHISPAPSASPPNVLKRESRKGFGTARRVPASQLTREAGCPPREG